MSSHHAGRAINLPGGDAGVPMLHCLSLPPRVIGLVLGLGLLCALGHAQAPESAPHAGGEPSFRELAEETQALVEAMAIITTMAEDDAAPDDAVTLTLRECLDMALANNPQVRIAEDAVDVADARVGQARALLRPQIGTSMTFTHLDLNTRTSPFPLNFFGDLTETGGTLRTDRVDATQVLYAGGQLRAALRASRYLAQSESWQRQATLDEIVYQTRQAYYGVLLATSLVEVALDSVRAFQRHVDDTTQMFDVGVVSQFEVLRSQTELGAREAELVRARNGVKLAYATLHRLLNLPQETPIRVVAEFPPIIGAIDFERLTRQALELRPEIRAIKDGIAASEESVTRTRGQFRPQIGASVQWQNVHNGGLAAPDGWTYSLAAQWDLYAGGRRKYEVNEARANLRSLEHQLEDLESLVRLDVNQAYINLYNAMAQMLSEHGTVALAREGLRLAILRFEEGVGTQSETLDAELALTNAQTGLARAVHEYAVARAALERAVGAAWDNRVAPVDITPAAGVEPDLEAANGVE
jgi:outer membrane protein